MGSNNVSEYLITLPEGKAHLKVTGDAEDATILALIGSCTFTIESYIGNSIVQKTFTEDYTAGKGRKLGGARRIHLRNYPVSSVTSITDDESTTVAATDYTIIADKGILEHDWRWPAPFGRWTVIYVAGRYATTDDVEQNFKMACKLLLADVYNLPQSNIQAQKIGDLSITYKDLAEFSSSTMPPMVRTILDPFRSVSV